MFQSVLNETTEGGRGIKAERVGNGVTVCVVRSRSEDRGGGFPKGLGRRTDGRSPVSLRESHRGGRRRRDVSWDDPRCRLKERIRRDFVSRDALYF